MMSHVFFFWFDFFLINFQCSRSHWMRNAIVFSEEIKLQPTNKQFFFLFLFLVCGFSDEMMSGI